MGIQIAGIDLDDMKDALLKKAQQKAKELERGKFGRSLNTSKLRSYYNSILSISNRLEKEPDNESVWTEFYLLKAKVNYDKQRKVVNDEFVGFITEAVDVISNTKNIDSLKRFRIFFEAVVGFFPRSTSN